MDDDPRVIDKGWDGLPEYGKSGDADEAVTVSISTAPGEWLVNTRDSVVVPMSMAELVVALQRHDLTERSLVWRAGMQEWAPIDRVPQLKLAARMPVKQPVATPPAAAPAPPPPAPLAAPVALQSTPGRRSTLPFGLPPNPSRSAPRPASPRPSSSPRAALPPPASPEEPEVLAVYDRPIATTSFDLSPAQPLRVAAPPAASLPQTLAPITTDSSSRRAPRNADLSVVAASEFRQVQRTSKRLVWLSSLGSAAAASILTLAIARSPSAPASAAATRALAPAMSVAAASASAAPAAPAALAEAAPNVPAAEAPSAEPSVSSIKPKAAPRRAKAASAARRMRPPPAAAEVAPESVEQPGAEPNPYDNKTEESPARVKPALPAATPPPSSASESKSDESAPGDSATSPGF